MITRFQSVNVSSKNPKVLSLLCMAILCAILFFGCGSDDMGVSTHVDDKPRVTATINENRHFVITPEEFRDQFNAAKVPGIDALDAFEVVEHEEGTPRKRFSLM